MADGRDPRVTRSALRRDTLIYAAGGLAGKGAAVILLPVLARALGPADYGRFDVIGTLGSALTIILMLGLDAATTRLAADERSTDGKRRLLSTALLALAAGGLAAAAALLVLADPLARWLTGTTATAPAVALLAVIVPVGVLNYFFLNVLRLDDRPVAFAVLSGSVLVGNAALVIASVTLLDGGLIAVVAAWAVSLVAVTSVSYWLTRGWFTREIDARRLRSVLGYGFPLVPAAGCVALVDLAHRAVLLGARGPDVAAQVAVAVRIATVVGLAGTAFQLAWQPRAYARGLEQARLGETASEALRAFAVLASITMVMVVTAPWTVGVLAGPGYQASADLVLPIAISAWLAATIPVVAVGSALARRPSDISIAMVAASLTGLACAVALIPTLGAVGTAIGMASGNLVGLIAMIAMARTRVRVPYDLRRAAAIASAGALVIVAISAWGLEGSLVGIVATIAAIGALWLGVLNGEVRRPTLGASKP